MNTATKTSKSQYYKQVLQLMDKLSKEELAELRVLMLLQISKGQQKVITIGKRPIGAA